MTRVAACPFVDRVLPLEAIETAVVVGLVRLLVVLHRLRVTEAGTASRSLPDTA